MFLNELSAKETDEARESFMKTHHKILFIDSETNMMVIIKVLEGSKMRVLLQQILGGGGKTGIPRRRSSHQDRRPAPL